MRDAEDGAATVIAEMRAMGARAREAALELRAAPAAAKAAALAAAAQAVRAGAAELLAENASDLAEARDKGLSAPMLDRLALDPARVEAIAAGLEAVAAQEDPVGRVLAEWTRPNGLTIRRVSTPIGVVGVIYESRPNVTADAGAICLKSGNAVILRGGSESFRSARALHARLGEGLAAAGLPRDAIQIAQSRDRAVVGAMLSEMAEFIDVIVPRGGKSLVGRVQAEARVPVFAHLEGICHVYLDAAADAEKARAVAVNAKMRRTSVCGAAECLLFDRAAPELAAPVLAALAEAGCEIRADAELRAAFPAARPAEQADFGREFLDAVIAARMVDGVDGAVAHVRAHGSGHTDAIVTEDDAAAARFFAGLDSAILLRNASTQFADGGEFGMGAEIGIATGKMHARGPIGAAELTTFQYHAVADLATRP